MMPAATVVVCPGTDALPGDEAPASPANVGQRVSALRTVRCTLAKRRRPRIALITTGEALARACPAPAAFDAEPPRVTVGSACDLATLAETLTDLGYIADERVDEPGELALRGAVLDVFPPMRTRRCGSRWAMAMSSRSDPTTPPTSAARARSSSASWAASPNRRWARNAAR